MLSDVVDVFNAAGYVYVENLTWVLLAPTNKARAAWARSPLAPHASAPAQMLAGPTAHIGRSHRTLLIFRRDVRTHPKGKEIELRHQRSPDVDVSIVRTGKGATRLRAWAVDTADSPQTGASSRPRQHTSRSRHSSPGRTRQASRAVSSSCGDTQRSGGQDGPTSRLLEETLLCAVGIDEGGKYVAVVQHRRIPAVARTRMKTWSLIGANRMKIDRSSRALPAGPLEDGYNAI